MKQSNWNSKDKKTNQTYMRISQNCPPETLTEKALNQRLQHSCLEL